MQFHSCLTSLLLIILVKPIGSGAFGEVFMATALGIDAFDPRSSVKKKSNRIRFFLRSNKKLFLSATKETSVAVKRLKGKFHIFFVKNLFDE